MWYNAPEIFDVFNFVYPLNNFFTWKWDRLILYSVFCKYLLKSFKISKKSHIYRIDSASKSIHSWNLITFFCRKNFQIRQSTDRNDSRSHSAREPCPVFDLKKKLHASIWRIFWLSGKENYTNSKCSKSSKKKNPSPESLNWNPQCKKEFETNLKNLIQDSKAWWTIFYRKKTLLNWSSAMIT